MGARETLKLTTLICADVFSFEDLHAQAVYDRGLILNIQLNPAPRHEKFLGSRERILGFAGDATEVVCLNWASGVCLWQGQAQTCWNNISASAWYIKAKEFDDGDNAQRENYQRGFYYTWHKPLRTHALFLNFDAATFLFEATKVAHIGVPGAVSKRRGPQLIKRCVWNDEDAEWSEHESAESGFSDISNESGNAENDIKGIVLENPLAAERVLALSAGEITEGDYWHTLRSLDSCVLDASEVILRVTFCQDGDERAKSFRIARLRRLSRLWSIINTDDKLPPSLEDIKDNVRLEWIRNSPHQNVISGEEKRATLIYMSEDSAVARVEEVKAKAAEYIRRYFTDDNERLSALQRLVVWYRDDDDQVEPLDPHHYVQFDEDREASEFDIGRRGMTVTAAQLHSRIVAHFPDAEQINNTIIRFTKRVKGHPYAVYYLDVEPDLPNTQEKLTNYQDRIIGSSYFKGDKSLQWSNYLYFITSRDQLKLGAVIDAKDLIERDRKYARKFVIPEEEVDLILEPPVISPTEVAPHEGILSIWSRSLEDAGLDSVIFSDDNLPGRLNMIEKPSAKAKIKVQILEPGKDIKDQPFLRSLELKKYRKFTSLCKFEFGKVNLIFGRNGSGKTSLLETIELFYCGRNKRNLDANPAYSLGVTFVDGKTETATNSRRKELFRTRNLKWYGQPEIRTNNLCQSFSPV